MKIWNRLRNIADLFNSIIGKDESIEFVKEREIVKLSDLVIAKVDALKEIQCSTHVFNHRQLVSSEIQLSLIKRVGKLVRMLDQLSSDFHRSIINKK